MIFLYLSLIFLNFRKLIKKTQKKYTVFYDRDCGFCHLCARILKRMDVFARLTWSDYLTKDNKPNKVNIIAGTQIQCIFLLVEF